MGTAGPSQDQEEQVAKRWKIPKRHFQRSIFILNSMWNLSSLDNLKHWHWFCFQFITLVIIKHNKKLSNINTQKGQLFTPLFFFFFKKKSGHIVRNSCKTTASLNSLYLGNMASSQSADFSLIISATVLIHLAASKIWIHLKFLTPSFSL